MCRVGGAFSRRHSRRYSWRTIYGPVASAHVFQAVVLGRRLAHPREGNPMRQLFLTSLVVEISLTAACPRGGIRTVRPQEALRSTPCSGQDLQGLVTALRAAQDRRRTLEQNLATLNSDAVPVGNRYRVTQTHLRLANHNCDSVKTAKPSTNE